MRVVLVAMVLFAGCTDDDGVDLCAPVSVDHSYQTFQLSRLDCLQVHATKECQDGCCIPEPDFQTSVEGVCKGGCFDDDQAACEADPTCFEIKDSEAFYKGTDAFLRCYEDPYPIASQTPCHQRTSLYDCVNLDPSGTRACTPLYTAGQTYLGCVAEADVADPCTAPVTCGDTAPSCGPGFVPAIVNGCYDRCIEQDWCR